MAPPVAPPRPPPFSDDLPASETGQAIAKPSTSPTQVQVENLQDEIQGARVHSFDPDLSPAEKAAQITASSREGAPIDDDARLGTAIGGGGGGMPSKMDMSAVPSLRGPELRRFKEQGGAELLTSDLGTAGDQVDVTASVRDVERATKTEKKDGKDKDQDRRVDRDAEPGGAAAGTTTTTSPEERARQALKDEGRVDQDGNEVPPGAMPGKDAEKGQVREIPAWFQIGWTGQDRSLFLSPQDRSSKAILEDFLSDAYYGQWRGGPRADVSPPVRPPFDRYHNAGIITFSVLSTHFLTLFGAGWGWMIVVLAVCATYYQTSVRRVRRNARDDLAREVAKKGLRSDVETATWINQFLQRFWLIYEPVLSKTIVASVDQVLSVSTPAFLDSIRMTTFTLGTKPPHLDHVKTFADTEDDIVLMEMKLSFVPNDVLDMTHAEADRKVNPKIVLNVRFGVGPASVGKDIVVEDLMFTGVMRIKLKLVNNFPHVQTVDLSFMQPPDFDFVLKPVGFDLSMIPGLSGFITSTVHSILGPMMYDPNSFTLNLEQLLSGAPLDTAIGVLAVTVHNARGVKGTKQLGGKPDPYVSFSINGRAELGRTSTKHATENPAWKKETQYILLNNLNETLVMTIYDENTNRSDSVCGTVSFPLQELEDEAQRNEEGASIMLDGKEKGRLRFDCVFSPVMTPKKLADGTVEPVPETVTGVVRLVVHAGKDLDSRGRAINPFFKLTLNNKPIHRSQTLKRTPNPIWERPCEFLVTAKPTAVIGVEVMDDNSILADSRLGIVKIRLQDVLESNKKGNDWFPLSNARSGKVRLTAEWKPVNMAGAINGASVYTPPIGVVRFWFKHSRGLRNVELNGKSDPYVRVMFHGIVVARTVVHDNNLNPDYDEIVYVQVHSPKDTFPIEVMDYQSNSNDRSLGNTLFSVEQLVAAGPDPVKKPWVGTGKVARNDPLVSNHNKPVKGNIEYEAEFFPCENLKDLSFEVPDLNANRIEEEVVPRDGTDRGSIADSAAGEAVGRPSTTSATTTASGSPLVRNPSIATAPSTRTTNGTPQAGSVDLKRAGSVTKPERQGITMSKFELMQAQTGILAFQIISGHLPSKRRGTRLEVLFDDGYWPAYTTEPARSQNPTWDEIGEVLIRELDFSRITFQLNSAEKDSREDVVALATMDVPTFLEESLNKVATIVLEPLVPGHGGKAMIKVMAKYIPVDMQILSRESIKNAGILSVRLGGAQGLPSADRNGKSDPYAVFDLNGARVHKSQVKKKTLAPEWNETFDCAVPRRDIANLVVEVWDWDRLGGDDKLGRATVDLGKLEAEDGSLITTPVPLTLDLEDFKTGKPAGTVKLSILFRPEFVRAARRSTGTVTGAIGRIGTTLGGGALAVGGGVIGAGGAIGRAGVQGVGTVGKFGVQGVGTVGKAGFHGVGTVGKFGIKGVGAVGKGVFGGAKRLTGHARTKSGEVVPIALDDQGRPMLDDRGRPLIVDGTNLVAAGDSLEVLGDANTNGAAGAEGTLRVQVGTLTGVGEDGEKKAVQIKVVGGKTILETHSHKGDASGVHFTESATVKSDGGAVALEVSVIHKKLFGSDEVLGTATINATDYVNALSPEEKINLPIDGPTPGSLELVLSFLPVPSVPNGAGSLHDAGYDTRSLAGSVGPSGSIIGSPSPKSRSRFSSGRFGRHKDKDADA
ncbi:hypothetical protein JCM10212_003569 [Sporobolomyces blumeae]